MIAKLGWADVEYGGDAFGNGNFSVCHEDTIKPYVDKAYQADGSLVAKKEIERFDKLLERYDFDSAESYGDLLASPDVAKTMWGDGEVDIEYTGNEGAT